MEQKRVIDMEEKEYREYYFKSDNWKSRDWYIKLAKCIYVLQFKFIKDPGWRVKRRLNPYNPLTYTLIIGIILSVLLYAVFEAVAEISSDSRRVFKYE